MTASQSRSAFALLRLLSPQELLECFHKARERAVDFARLLAAFYLDFPLLLPSNDTDRLPTLFAWSELSPQDASSFQSLERTEFAVRLPTCYSPKLPAVLLARSGFVLEAILYADHFADRRSTVVLRMYGDLNYGLNLTKQYCADLISDTLSRSIAGLIASPVHYEISLSRLEENVVQSLLELDIVTNESYISRLETAIMNKMEILFAQLPITVHEENLLPRAPLYCAQQYQPNANLSSEEMIHLKLHAYMRLFVRSLSKTNRLDEEMGSSLSVLAQFDFMIEKDTPRIHSSICSNLSRLILLILRLIYRDEFSLAAKTHNGQISRVAEKYKALLMDDENESDLKAFERFFSMSTESDAEHIRSFIDWLRTNRSRTNTLPPYSRTTREMWHDHLIGAMATQGTVASARTEDNDCRWFLAKISDDVKVDPARYRQMRFVAEQWTAYAATTEGGLITLRLHLAPGDLCSSRGGEVRDRISPAAPMTSRFPTVTARSYPDRATPSIAGSLSFRSDEDDVRQQRIDLISEYARRKLERKHSMRGMPQPPPTSRPIYFKNTMRERLREVSAFQRSLEAQLDEEDCYLESISQHNKPRSRPPATNNNQSVQTNLNSGRSTGRRSRWDDPPLTKEEAKIQLEKTIQEDLSRLNEKLERISHFLVDEPASIEDDQIDDVILESDNLHVRGVFDTDEVKEVASTLPPIEKLDFRALTPPPDVGRRRPSEASTIISKSASKSGRTIGHLPEWLKLVPLKTPNAPVYPPLSHAKVPSKSSASHFVPTASASATHADRGCQSEVLNVESLSYRHAPIERPVLVKEMSADRVHTMIKSFL